MSYQDEISLSRQTIIRVLGVTTFLLLVASTAGQIARHVFGHPGLMGFVPLFYVDQEGNVPTFFFCRFVAVRIPSSCAHQSAQENIE